jgi:hypothetical protein
MGGMRISEDSVTNGKGYVALLVTVVLVFGMFVGLAGRSSADTGGWDVYGYSWTDSNAPGDQVSFSWVEISGTGTDTTLWGDDSCTAIDMGFSFEFYGDAYSYAYVTSNGLLSFEGYIYEDYNDPMPYSSSPDLLVAPFWDDLAVGSYYNSGAVYYETLGTTPNQQFIVEYYQVTRDGYSDEMTFEVILNETGEMWFQYLTLNGEAGASASVGIEDYWGWVGSEYSYNSPSLSDSLAIVFELGPIGFGSPQSYTGYPGDTLTYELTITNNRLVDDLFDFTFASTYGWTAAVCDEYGVPVADSDVDTYPDTGVMASGASMYVYVWVTIPVSPTERVENTTIVATSDLLISDTAQVTLVSETVGAMFAPPHADYGDDSEPDGLYDYLVVEVSVDVLFDGTYDIEASLYDSSYGYVAGSSATNYLPAGSHAVSIYFDGPTIFAFGTDGVYYVTLYLYDQDGYIGYGSHVTASYLCSEFEPPVACFDPPHSERTVDMNSDGYYEYLVVEVQVDVLEADTYQVYGELYDDGGGWITSCYNVTYLDIGLQMIELWFSGYDIYYEYAYGPYAVEMTLYDSGGSPIDFDTYTTADYSYYDFDYDVAWFAPPHSDAGVDTNGNTFYDWLVVYASVYILVEGDYEVYGYLYAPSATYVTYSSNSTYLYEGDQIVELWFDGSDIFDSGESGSFDVEMYVEYDWDTQDYDLYTTSVYSYDEFEPPGAYFSPPHDDWGEDSDLNGLYDDLVIEVSLNATIEGTYYLYGYLYNSGGEYLVYTSTSVYLLVGENLAYLYFPGEYIYGGHADGPFRASMDLYDASWDYVDWDQHYTDAYGYDEFEAPDASFLPPHSDAGVDDDADTLYEWLEVTVYIDVMTSGDYYLVAYLYWDWDYITTIETLTYLDAGTDSVSLMFPGWMLNAMGYDSECQIDLDIYTESYVWLDDDFHETGLYSWDAFDDDMPSIESQWTSVAPTIDGVVDSEWDAAEVVDLLAADVENELEAYMLVMNNATHLFIAYDVVGDEHEDYDDFASFGFDNGNDGVLVDGSEDQFMMYAGTDETYHYAYDDWWGDWEYDCGPFDPDLTDHGGLAGAFGFGTSPLYASDHRTFEFSIPLALLGVTVGDTLGFVATSEYEPGVFDSWYWDESYWPLYDTDVYDQAFYGDLVLAQAVVVTPETTASLAGTLGGGGWYTSDVTVTLEATGGEGGVDYTMYSIDGGSWTTYTVPFDVTADGITTVEFYSVDMVGHEEEIDVVDVMIDTVAPSSAHSLDDYVVTLTATDASSGVDAIYYRIDGGSWIEYSSPFAVSGAGSHDVDYYAADVAGNDEASDSFSVAGEEDAPVTESDLDGTAGLLGWFVSEVEVTLTADDGDGSGVDATYYCIDDGSWVTYSSPFDLTEDGAHTVEFYSSDMAGNDEAAQAIQVNIDTVVPTATSSVDGFEVTLSGADETSGVSMIVYRIDGGDWLVYDGAFVVEGSGNHTVEYFAADNAGNEGIVQSVVVEGSGGGISAVLIGALIGAAVLAAVGLLLFLVIRKKKGQQQAPPPPEMMPPPPPAQ